MPDHHEYKRLSRPAAVGKTSYVAAERRLHQHLNAAQKHRETQQYEQQLLSLTSAHSIYRELIASGEQNIVESVSEAHLFREMASAHEHLSNYHEQIKCLQEALRISEVARKENISEVERMSNVVEICRKLREAYGKVNDYTNQAILRKKALEYQNRMVEIARRTFGDKLKVAKELGTLAILFGEEMDYQKQIELLFESLRIMLERAPEHHIVAEIYNNLGMAYGELRDRDRQKEYLNLAFKMYTKILGADHMLTKRVQKKLSIVYEHEVVKFFKELRLDASLILEEIMEKVEMLIEKILNLLPEQRTLKSEALLEYLLQYQEESMQHLNFLSVRLNPNPRPDAEAPNAAGGADDCGEPCCCYGAPPFMHVETNLTTTSDFS